MDVQIAPYYSAKIGDLPNADVSQRRPVGVEDISQRRPHFVSLRFTPAHWVRNDAMVDFLTKGLGIGVNDDWGPGSTPDEVLLHELVHALFRVSGTHSSFRRRVPFQGRRYLTASRSEKHKNWRGPNEMNEFMAILITNIYHSEIGRDKIRHSHTDSIPHEISAEAFLDIGMNRAHIRLLRRKHPRLFNILNDVKAAWNPLKYFRDSWLD